MKYRGLALILLLCIAAIIAAGCMGISQSSRANLATDTTPMPAVAEKFGGSYSGDSWSGSVVTAAPTMSGTGTAQAASDQKIIRTASIAIEVSDVTAAADALKSLAAGKGGYLSSTSIQKTSTNRFYGTVVLRVPAVAFDETLAGIKGIGTVKSVSAQNSDVTEEYTESCAHRRHPTRTSWHSIIPL
jgi:hypothetical protein